MVHIAALVLEATPAMLQKDHKNAERYDQKYLYRYSFLPQKMRIFIKPFSYLLSIGVGVLLKLIISISLKKE